MRGTLSKNSSLCFSTSLLVWHHNHGQASGKNLNTAQENGCYRWCRGLTSTRVLQAAHITAVKVRHLAFPASHNFIPQAATERRARGIWGRAPTWTIGHLMTSQEFAWLRRGAFTPQVWRCRCRLRAPAAEGRSFCVCVCVYVWGNQLNGQN